MIALLAAAHAAHAASDTIAVPPIRWLSILPPIIMIGGAVVLLGVASLVRSPLRVRVSTIATVVISGGALGVALWQWSDVQEHGPHTYIAQAVVMDGFSVLVTMLVAIAMLLSALVADGYLRREGVQGAEFHVLAMVSASGAMLMGMANDLIIVFLGLEILSIALYVLAAFNYRRAASGEAALKYFILGGFSSAIFVYGIALTYGATGSTNLTQIADFLSKNVVLEQRPAAGRALADAGGLLLQDRRGAVPHVDARRVPGVAVAGDRVHGGRGEGGRVRRHAAGAALVLRRGVHRLAADRLRAGRAVPRPRCVRGAAPARREADAGLLVDQPRGLHPARRGGRHGPGRRARPSTTSSCTCSWPSAASPS